MRNRKISESVALFVVSAAAIVIAAQPIRVSWQSPIQFAQRPVFRTNSIQEPGTVIVHVRLSAEGGVAEAKVVAGDPELRSVVQESLRNWRFGHATGQPGSFPVYVYFTTDDGTRKGARPLPPPPPFGAVIGSIDITAVSKDVQDRVAKMIGVKTGDVLTEDVMNSIRAKVKNFDPPLRFWVTLGTNAQPIVHISGS